MRRPPLPTLALLGASVAILFATTTAPAAGQADPACSKQTAAAVAVADSSGFAARVTRQLGTWLRDGEHVMELFTLRRVHCRDLTRDGQPEMVVELVCCTVSSPSPWGILQRDGAGRWQAVFTRTTTVFRLRVRGGEVVAKLPRYRRTDPSCCPSSFRYEHVRWDGAAFVARTTRRAR